MDFHAVRQLMVKSRHKILMPILVLHLTKTKLNQGEYRSSFARNLHERTDRPVFTIEEAVSELKTGDPKRTDVEKAMDEFFMTHLPEDVIKAARDHHNNELVEDSVRRVKRSEIPMKKYRTQVESCNSPYSFNRNRILPVDIPTRKNKKRKSDFTSAFIDSSQQVAKLALISEVGQKIQEMRSLAKSQYRLSPPSSTCQSQGMNGDLETLSPSPKKKKHTLTPGAFRRIHSQHLSAGLATTKGIESIFVERQADYKTLEDMKDWSPSMKRVDTVRETDKEDSVVSEKDSTLKENPPYLLDPEKSESVQNDAFGELDVNGDERGDVNGDERGDARADERGGAKGDD
jgi:hypothetical protein